MGSAAAANQGFRFDSHQQYQLDAINAVVDLFDGQPRDAEKLSTTLRGTIGSDDGSAQAGLPVDMAQEIGAIGNNLVIDHTSIPVRVKVVVA